MVRRPKTFTANQLNATYGKYHYTSADSVFRRGPILRCPKGLQRGDHWPERHPRAASQVGWAEMTGHVVKANKTVETNRRPASPLDGGRKSGSASYAPPSLSAAFAHLCR